MTVYSLEQLAGLLFEEEQEALALYYHYERSGYSVEDPQMTLLNGRIIGLQRARDIITYASRSLPTDLLGIDEVEE